ncbi:MAG: glycosyltransferase family 39 protein [Bacteroidota bacterium]
MLEAIRRRWNEQPLGLIIFLALFFRLLAVIFAKGYGMHDDHFLVIEPAQSWADDFDYNDWFVRTPPHSLFYTGLHYFLFEGLQAAGLSDPQWKMYIVRFLHALLSVVTIVAAYRIADHFSGKQSARLAGLLLALYWFMPWLSVRNLVEVVCIPFLLLAAWLLIRPIPKRYAMSFVLAGILSGMAFSVRYQSVLFTGGLGLVLLWQKKWKESFLIAGGWLGTVALLEGWVDYLIWDRPFAAFSTYMEYNIAYADKYFTQAWYTYLLFLGGVLIPPVSIFLFIGFFRTWKKYTLLFLPAFLFLLFHSLFPNKQERFILPVVPFIILLGVIGWNEWVAGSSFWKSRGRLLSACWAFFWLLNAAPLLVVSLSYSKKSFVEAMVYLSEKEDYRRFIIEESNKEAFTMPPFFYLGKWYTDGYIQGITRRVPLDSACAAMERDPGLRPNYVLFFDKEDLEKRISDFRKRFPRISYQTTIEPGFVDKLMHRLNPINRNLAVTIYKIED